MLARLIAGPPDGADEDTDDGGWFTFDLGSASLAGVELIHPLEDGAVSGERLGIEVTRIDDERHMGAASVERIRVTRGAERFDLGTFRARASRTLDQREGT